MRVGSRFCGFSGFIRDDAPHIILFPEVGFDERFS